MLEKLNLLLFHFDEVPSSFFVSVLRNQSCKNNRAKLTMDISNDKSKRMSMYLITSHVSEKKTRFAIAWVLIEFIQFLYIRMVDYIDMVSKWRTANWWALYEQQQKEICFFSHLYLRGKIRKHFCWFTG